MAYPPKFMRTRVNLAFCQGLWIWVQGAVLLEIKWMLQAVGLTAIQPRLAIMVNDNQIFWGFKADSRKVCNPQAHEVWYFHTGSHFQVRRHLNFLAYWSTPSNCVCNQVDISILRHASHRPTSPTTWLGFKAFLEALLLSRIQWIGWAYL